MSDEARIRINTGLLIFAASGLVAGVAAFSALRSDVANLAAEVRRLNSDHDTVTRHEVEINAIRSDVDKLRK